MSPSVEASILATNHNTESSAVPESARGTSATTIRYLALLGTRPQLRGGATLAKSPPCSSANCPVAVASGSEKSIVPAEITADGGRVGPGVLSSRPDVEHPARSTTATRNCARRDE